MPRDEFVPQYNRLIDEAYRAANMSHAHLEASGTLCRSHHEREYHFAFAVPGHGQFHRRADAEEAAREANEMVYHIQVERLPYGPEGPVEDRLDINIAVAVPPGLTLHRVAYIVVPGNRRFPDEWDARQTMSPESRLYAVDVQCILPERPDTPTSHSPRSVRFES
jgi:hypothetical protein